MNKFRNSLLSVAAAAAMTSTVLTANYVPLTSSTTDDRWVLFGVGEFATDGTPATEPGVFRIVSSIKNTVTDTDQTDDIFGVGLQATGGKNLGKVKAISSGVVLEVRVDTTTDSIPYVETEPFRTMYVDTTGEGAPTFAFTYKASLEGLTLEYSVDGGLAYELTISSAGTYSDPIPGVKISGLDATSGTYSLTDLTGTDSAVDFDFTNNPQVATEFRTTHRNDKGGNDNLRAYSYDADNKLWNIFDSANTADTNNFTELMAGKAYWAKMDTDTGSGANATETQGGIVLGTPSISTADYTAANLVDGWNLISFDATQPNIRHSSTGMKVDLNATTTGLIQILDSTNTQSVDVNASGGAVAVSKKINSALYAAKLNGTIPYTLDIKSFPSATNSLVLISNKRFSLQDAGVSVLSAKSLFDEKLLDPSTFEAITDYNVSSTGVTSKYGEYALIVEPLVGTDSVAAQNSQVQVEAYEGPLETDTNKTTVKVVDLSTFITNMSAHASLKASALSLDVNATFSDVLITSEHPFNLRDQTFTRVFEFLGTNAVDSVVTVTGADTQNVATANIVANTADTTTGATNAAASIDQTGTGMRATSKDEYVVTVANVLGAVDYKVYETKDLLKVAAASSVGDLSKGAIAGVYSLDYLAGLTVKNNTEINTTQFDLGVDANDTNDSMIITYTTEFQDINGTSFAANSGGFTLDSGENNLTVINAVVSAINTDFADLGITSTASHDYNKTNIDSYVITITGEDIKGISLNKVEGSDGGTSVDAATPSDTGYTNTPTPDIAADLKNNSVYTPDYVLDGPLYTMKENGMTLKALVTGTTKMSDGTVAWDSIDLTRKPSEWLDSQDYNLFKVDAKAGYWAFLETDTGANNLSVALTPIVGTYVHHFDGTDNKTYNTFSANLEVTVTGLDATDTLDNGKGVRVTATINGKTTELTRNTGTSVFDGKISNNETEGFSSGSNYELIIDVADGLGYKYQQTFANAFDNVQPDVPSTTGLNGVIQVDTNDTSVAGFYVYNGAIDENDLTTLEADGGNLMGHLTSAGTVTAACENSPAVIWSDDSGTIKIISVDGTGILGGGNASDAATENFMPILKSRVFLENINNGTQTVSNGGLDYNASCENLGEVNVNTGVSLSAVTSDKTVKLAYPNLGEKVVTAVPITVYVKNTAGTIAQLTYPSTYVGESVFVEIDGEVFGYSLPDATATEIHSSTPLDLTGLTNNPKTGITL